MSTRGFTLIELMISVAIVAILAAVAYPSYLSFVTRGSRSQGEQFLMDLAQSQERYRLDRGNYMQATDLALAGIVPPPAVSKYYTLAAPYVATPPALPFFAAELTPKAGTLQAGDGRLIINSRGESWRESSTCILGSGCSPTSATATAWN